MVFPFLKKVNTPALGRWLLVLTALAGAGVRVAVYLQNRSFFLDEANLARNIAERGLGDLTQPLHYEQFAPLVFLWVSKINALLLGNTEYALRLLPLLAGLAAIFIFYKISTRLIPTLPARWVAIWVFAFHTGLLRYATECKQYGTDAFAAALAIWLALEQGQRSFRLKQAAGWALLGLALIWFSMPVVFVLSGVGLYWLFLYWRKKDRKSLALVAASIALWLAGFAVFFFTMLKQDAESDYLRQYHQPYFLPLLPLSAAEWKQWGGLLLQLIKSFSGHTAVAQAIGFLGLLAAWVHWARRRPELAILLGMPLLTCLAVSGLHYYSLISRLTLFLVPILLLTSAYGWHVLWEKAGNWLKPVVAACLVLMASSHDTYRFFRQPFETDGLRQVLAFVEVRQQPADGLYLWKWAVPGYDFYTRLHLEPMSFEVAELVKSEQRFSEDLRRLSDGTPGLERVWLVYNHLMSRSSLDEMEQELAQFRRLGSVEEVFRESNAAVWIWIQNQESRASASTPAAGG